MQTKVEPVVVEGLATTYQCVAVNDADEQVRFLCGDENQAQAIKRALDAGAMTFYCVCGEVSE